MSAEIIPLFGRKAPSRTLSTAQSENGASIAHFLNDGRQAHDDYEYYLEHQSLVNEVFSSGFSIKDYLVDVREIRANHPDVVQHRRAMQCLAFGVLTDRLANSVWRQWRDDPHLYAAYYYELDERYQTVKATVAAQVRSM